VLVFELEVLGLRLPLSDGLLDGGAVTLPETESDAVLLLDGVLEGVVDTVLLLEGVLDGVLDGVIVGQSKRTTRLNK
jgi:hypothetical protein